MIQLIDVNRYDATMLDRIVKVAVPIAFGVNVSPSGTVVLLPDTASTLEQNKVEDVMRNFSTLVVTADKTNLIEGDADPVISCADALIASDPTVTYMVLLDGNEYASGTADVTGGIATLNLITPVAGIYDIVIYRTIGNFASGFLTISVSQV